MGAGRSRLGWKRDGREQPSLELSKIQQRRTGVTFAIVAEDWYEHGLLERDWSPSTRADYRSALNAHLLPSPWELRIESVTPHELAGSPVATPSGCWP